MIRAELGKNNEAIQRAVGEAIGTMCREVEERLLAKISQNQFSFRGAWREGETYQCGDVTAVPAVGIYRAERTTQARPGGADGAWLLLSQGWKRRPRWPRRQRLHAAAAGAARRTAKALPRASRSSALARSSSSSSIALVELAHGGRLPVIVGLHSLVVEGDSVFVMFDLLTDRARTAPPFFEYQRPREVGRDEISEFRRGWHRQATTARHCTRRAACCHSGCVAEPQGADVTPCGLHPLTDYPSLLLKLPEPHEATSSHPSYPHRCTPSRRRRRTVGEVDFVHRRFCVHCRKRITRRRTTRAPPFRYLSAASEDRRHTSATARKPSPMPRVGVRGRGQRVSPGPVPSVGRASGRSTSPIDRRSRFAVSPASRASPPAAAGETR